MGLRLVLSGTAALLAATAMTVPATAAPKDEVIAEIAPNHDEALDRLKQWIALPTIANMGVNHKEGAEFMRQLALDAGFQKARIVPTKGVPGVFATLDAGAPVTLAIYFMYDVKHYDPAEWTSPPLESRMIDKPGEGKAIVGRGAVNQKGPQAAFLAALHAFKDSGVKPPVNLVLVAEGEEEIGSTNFRDIIADPEVRAALSKAVGVMMPSTGQARDGSAEIDLGAKGVIEVQLVSSGERWGRGPAKDVHSSLMAIVDNPAWRLVKALDTLVADDGFTPAIDGWFENVAPLTDRQKQMIAQSYSEEENAQTMQQLGVKRWIKDEDGLTAAYRLVSQPTVNIQGLVSGYTGPGGKTVLPGRAEAKLDFRLVPNMTREEAEAKLKAHLAKRGFSDIEVIVSGGYGPTQTDENAAIVKAAAAAYRKAGIDYSFDPRRAGSWPGVVFTGEPLKLPAGHFGSGRGGGAHAPDEWLLIESANPKVNGFDGQAKLFVDYLYEVAAAAKKGR
ncbi:MAG: M20/M25/M40 family metallo-hydrolase [Alphaproteobacteria bacterium]